LTRTTDIRSALAYGSRRRGQTSRLCGPEVTRSSNKIQTPACESHDTSLSNGDAWRAPAFWAIGDDAVPNRVNNLQPLQHLTGSSTLQMTSVPSVVRSPDTSISTRRRRYELVRLTCVALESSCRHFTCEWRHPIT
jgi:hypothetical protein